MLSHDKVVKMNCRPRHHCVFQWKRGEGTEISEEIPDVDPSPHTHADSPKILYSRAEACVSESSWLYSLITDDNRKIIKSHQINST